MPEALEADQLLRTVGAFTQSHKGEKLGEITEIKINEQDQPEYIILKSNTCFGRGDRFFAVPATSKLVKFSGKGNIILQADKDNLQFAKGIAANMLPKPNLTTTSERSIFEIYNYTAPARKNTNKINERQITDDEISRRTL